MFGQEKVYPVAEMHPIPAMNAVSIASKLFLKPKLGRIRINQKIDITFAQKYICERGNCDVNLQIPDGRTWSVTNKEDDSIRYNREGVARNRYPSYCIKSVLLAYREEVARIRYQVGDTCVFEMIKQQPEKTFT